MDYAKCSLCKEKDHTGNMLMPCKCDRWVHRDCLNKKRISDPAYFHECPLCQTKYNMEKKVIPPWRKYAEIVGSVMLDVFVFFVLFVACSAFTGKIAVLMGIRTTHRPVVVGAMIILGILGFISLLYGMGELMLGHGHFFLMPNMECRDESALLVFVLIGAVVLIAVTVWWAYKTISERIERHKRSVGVREFVVTDYTRGIADI